MNKARGHWYLGENGACLASPLRENALTQGLNAPAILNNRPAPTGARTVPRSNKPHALPSP